MNAKAILGHCERPLADDVQRRGLVPRTKNQALVFYNQDRIVLEVYMTLATTTVRLDANNTSYTSRPGPLHDQPSPDQEPEKSKERFVSNSDEHRLLLTFDVLSRLCLLIHTSAAVSSHGDYSSLRDGTLPVPIRFCFRGGVFDVIFVFDSIFSTRCVRFLIVRDFSVVGGKLKAVRRCHWLLTFERCVNRSD
ncbi:hypothetical protein F2P81_012909 [Scophthalmus maximus]|uniref:Uncharacterized protein n=1 Tax=Scophthalmus maximus TaxID=52904 RepID=A0A6A4SVQ6_SCOMX|nr:hypothetical protein F2P81_012909 [Scophthalmus maximus]